VTKADIVNIVSNATGLTKVDTEAVINGFIQVVKDALQRGDRVDLRGFGSFNVVIRKPKKARRPGTDIEIVLPERVVPIFKPSKLLKESIKLTPNDLK